MQEQPPLSFEALDIIRTNLLNSEVHHQSKAPIQQGYWIVTLCSGLCTQTSFMMSICNFALFKAHLKKFLLDC